MLSHDDGDIDVRLVHLAHEQLDRTTKMWAAPERERIDIAGILDGGTPPVEVDVKETLEGRLDSNLLNGSMRIPGFSEPWRMVLLRNHVRFLDRSYRAG